MNPCKSGLNKILTYTLDIIWHWPENGLHDQLDHFHFRVFWLLLESIFMILFHCLKNAFHFLFYSLAQKKLSWSRRGKVWSRKRKWNIFSLNRIIFKILFFECNLFEYFLVIRSFLWGKKGYFRWLFHTRNISYNLYFKILYIYIFNKHAWNSHSDLSYPSQIKPLINIL